MLNFWIMKKKRWKLCFKVPLGKQPLCSFEIFYLFWGTVVQIFTFYSIHYLLQTTATIAFFSNRWKRWAPSWFYIPIFLYQNWQPIPLQLNLSIPQGLLTLYYKEGTVKIARQQSGKLSSLLLNVLPLTTSLSVSHRKWQLVWYQDKVF